MKNPYQNWLLGVLEDLFKGKQIEKTHKLFPVARELIQCAVADGWLTKPEVMEVIADYVANAA